tara:strand:- start:257 stop:1033 length:777 start_codon:yes stop_codon:yes gene_type:complete
MNPKQHSDLVFLVLSAIFISSLIICNLIFLKFFQIQIWIPFVGSYTFVQSVGLLAYPVTFLVTDVVSEIYGQKKANQVITAGLIASLFMVAMISIADSVPSAANGIGDILAYNPMTELKDLNGKTIPGSGMEQNIFKIVFGLSSVAVFASMMAYLIAQFIDVRLFHFWKKLTNGRHLWLRNNASTIFSQLVDTLTVLLLLCYFGAVEWVNFTTYFLNGFLFKIFFAAFDTPIIYMCCNYLRNKYRLEFGQSISEKNKT